MNQKKFSFSGKPDVRFSSLKDVNNFLGITRSDDRDFNPEDAYEDALKWRRDANSDEILVKMGCLDPNFYAKSVAYKAKLLLAANQEAAETDGTSIIVNDKLMKVPNTVVEAIMDGEDDPFSFTPASRANDFPLDELKKLNLKEIESKLLTVNDINFIMTEAINTASSTAIQSSAEFLSHLEATCGGIISSAGAEVQVLYQDIKSDIASLEQYDPLTSVSTIVSRLSSKTNDGSELPDIVDNQLSGLTGCGGWVALGNLIKQGGALVSGAIAAIGSMVISIVSPPIGMAFQAITKVFEILTQPSSIAKCDKSGDEPVATNFFKWHTINNDIISGLPDGDYTLNPGFGYIYYSKHNGSGKIAVLPYCYEGCGTIGNTGERYSSSSLLLGQSFKNFLFPDQGVVTIEDMATSTDKDALYQNLIDDKVSKVGPSPLYVFLSPLFAEQKSILTRSQVLMKGATWSVVPFGLQPTYDKSKSSLIRMCFASYTPKMPQLFTDSYTVNAITDDDMTAPPNAGNGVSGWTFSANQLYLKLRSKFHTIDSNLKLAQYECGSEFDDIIYGADAGGYQIDYWDYAFLFCAELIKSGSVAMTDSIYVPKGFIQVKTDREQALQKGAAIMAVSVAVGSAAVAAGKFAYKKISRKKAQKAIKQYNDVLYRQDPPPTPKELVKAQKRMDRWSRKAGYTNPTPPFKQVNNNSFGFSDIIKLISGED